MKLFNPIILILLISLSCIACKEQKKPVKEVAQKETVDAVVTPTDVGDLLSESPRHHEWVDLKRADGTVMKAFVVYPESKGKTKSVIVIHENRGLNDWARYFADQLAAKGYMVIAPDLISNTVDGIEKTTDFENTDKAREAIYALEDDAVTADLNNSYAYIKADPASNGEVAVAGFCWGGSQTFRYATNNTEISSANVFYGTAPKEKEVFSTITAPVYGYYGGNDNRVNATIENTQVIMDALDKIYEPVIYEGAGHAFMRKGSEADTDEANKKAHDQAWKRLVEKLQK